MTVYVDDLFDYGNRGVWCHMATDNFGDMNELHDMAKVIGLRREWFQDHPLHPHYDLIPSKRYLAVQAGAESVSRQQLVRRCSKLFQRDCEED